MQDAHDALHEALNVVNIVDGIEVLEMRYWLRKQRLHTAPAHRDNGHGIADVFDGLKILVDFLACLSNGAIGTSQRIRKVVKYAVDAIANVIAIIAITI